MLLNGFLGLFQGTGQDKMTNGLTLKTSSTLYEALCAAFQTEVDPFIFILILPCLMKWLMMPFLSRMKVITVYGISRVACWPNAQRSRAIGGGNDHIGVGPQRPNDCIGLSGSRVGNKKPHDGYL